MLFTSTSLVKAQALMACSTSILVMKPGKGAMITGDYSMRGTGAVLKMRNLMPVSPLSHPPVSEGSDSLRLIADSGRARLLVDDTTGTAYVQRGD